MLQREVADRLTARLGSADYGRLTVMAQYHWPHRTPVRRSRHQLPTRPEGALRLRAPPPPPQPTQLRRERPVASAPDSVLQAPQNHRQRARPTRSEPFRPRPRTDSSAARTVRGRLRGTGPSIGPTWPNSAVNPPTRARPSRREGGHGATSNCPQEPRFRPSVRGRHDGANHVPTFVPTRITHSNPRQEPAFSSIPETKPALPSAPILFSHSFPQQNAGYPNFFNIWARLHQRDAICCGGDQTRSRGGRVRCGVRGVGRL